MSGALSGVSEQTDHVAAALWTECRCPGCFADGDPRGQQRFREIARAAVAAVAALQETSASMTCIECERSILPTASRTRWKGAWAHMECTAFPLYQHGCICPLGAEVTCRGLACPRRGFNVKAGL